jgi:hypothetical protein
MQEYVTTFRSCVGRRNGTAASDPCRQSSEEEEASWSSRSRRSFGNSSSKRLLKKLGDANVQRMIAELKRVLDADADPQQLETVKKTGSRGQRRRRIV